MSQKWKEGTGRTDRTETGQETLRTPPRDPSQIVKTVSNTFTRSLVDVLSSWREPESSASPSLPRSLLRSRSSSSACATSSSATRGMWPPRNASWHACVPCYIWSTHLARRWTYRRNVKSSPRPFETRVHGACAAAGLFATEKVLGTRAAHSLVVLNTPSHASGGIIMLQGSWYLP